MDLMNILQIVILVFVSLEILNIIVLYTSPTMKEGNGIGMFKTIHEIDEGSELFQLIKYLTNWVANVKVIFAALAITIVIFGDETTQMHAAFALIFSTFMFYFTMYPIIKKMDNEGRLLKRGYSKTLAYTILSFILTLIAGIVIYFLV
jgi:hypothetical protein